MATQKKVPEKMNVDRDKKSRQGKIYQLKHSARRAAKEDGLLPDEFEVAASARNDGFYYLKKSVATTLVDDLDPEEKAELEEENHREAAAQPLKCSYCGLEVATEDAVWVDPETGDATTGDKGKPWHVACAPAQARDTVPTEIRDPATQEKLLEVVVHTGDLGSSRAAEQVRTVVQNAKVVLAYETKVVDLTDEQMVALQNKTAIISPPKPPPTKTLTGIPRVRKSTVGGPTKLVWSVAEEMHEKNPKVVRRDVIAECVRVGIAYFTARTQYQLWLTTRRNEEREAGMTNGEKLAKARAEVAADRDE